MSTHASPRIGANDHDTRGAVAPRNPIRRLSTETKAAFKTTEFFSYVAVLAGILIAGAVVDSPTPAATAPARSGCTPRSSPSATWCPAAWRSPAAATRTTPTTATGSDFGLLVGGRIAAAGFASSDAGPAAS